MKKNLLWIFPVVLFCLPALAVASDTPEELLLTEECPIGYTLFGQIPTSFYDDDWDWYTSDISPGWKAFDNFSGLSDDICKITWWGHDNLDTTVVRDCTEDPMDFEVAFYPDDGSGKPDTLNPIYILPSVTISGTPTGYTYGPYNGQFLELNRYDLVLDTCISITEGWISVMGISYGGTPGNCKFTWQSSLQGDRILQRIEAGVWIQYQDDVAFCLRRVEYSPTYGACCDQSTGNCAYLEYQDCPEGARFEVNTLCEDLDPPCQRVVCEDFEFSLGTFTSYITGDSAGWLWFDDEGNPPGSAFHNDDYGSIDDWLISPGGYTVVAGDTLFWDQRNLWSSYITYHGVLISSDYVNGSDPTTATWTELYTGAACEECWETMSVDLSAYAGQTVHIAFRYQGNYSDRWWVDNVCIFGLSSCDYAVGDVNGSDSYNGLDITYGVAFFKGGNDPICYYCDCPPHTTFWACGDVNGTCSYNGLDITYGVAFFKGGADPIPCSDCPPGQ